MYKFNNGIGAVICDHCRVIIDEGIGFVEAQEIYGEESFCYECTHGHKPGHKSISVGDLATDNKPDNPNNNSCND